MTSVLMFLSCASSIITQLYFESEISSNSSFRNVQSSINMILVFFLDIFYMPDLYPT